ncbi:MAG: glycosyltransferase family 2 protein [Pseudomonadota bacterium]
MPVPRHTIEDGPQAVLIVPAKGRSEDTDLFLDALDKQDYQNFRVVWCIEQGDAAARQAFEQSALGHRGLIAEAEPAQVCAQKNANLIAGIGALQPDDELIILADCDCMPSKTWLAEIAAILVRKEADVVSAYRLQIPKSATWPNWIVAACESALASAPRVVRIGPMHVWGGTIALRRDTFDRVDYASNISDTFNDDLVATHLFAKHGLRVIVPRSMLIASFVAGNWQSSINFARRQYFATRIYSKILYVQGVVVLLVNTLFWVASITLALASQKTGLIALAVLFGSDFAKSWFRRRYFNDILGGQWMTNLRPIFLITTLMGPVLAIIHLGLALSSRFGTKITWSGRTYEVKTPNAVRVISHVLDKSPTRNV